MGTVIHLTIPVRCATQPKLTHTPSRLAPWGELSAARLTERGLTTDRIICVIPDLPLSTPLRFLHGLCRTKTTSPQGARQEVCAITQNQRDGSRAPTCVGFQTLDGKHLKSAFFRANADRKTSPLVMCLSTVRRQAPHPTNFGTCPLPPLCKGRWVAEGRPGGVVNTPPINGSR